MFYKNLNKKSDDISEYYPVRPMEALPSLVKISEKDIKDLEKEHGKIHRACSLDVETTGLDDTAEVIELAILEIFFVKNKDGYKILGIGREFNQLQEPKNPIPEEITNLTGITNEDVAGQSINWEAAKKLYNACELALAHNARFDFGKLKGLLFEDSKKIWACTLSDIPWKDLGFINSKQENLCMYHGFYYEGHRALTDLYANVHLISNSNYFDLLVNSVKEPQYIICALNTDYETKDNVQARGFRWFNDNKGKKFYYKILSKTEVEEEADWVSKNGYTKRRPQVRSMSINPMKRYDSLDNITSSLN